MTEKLGVTVIDYGLGNLRSVTRGLEKAGAEVEISSQPGDVRTADSLVLPGVGAFAEGMEGASDLQDAIKESAEDTPLLGICLGMQMLLSESEEGSGETVEGLDLIPGKVSRFPENVGKVPHMGWNSLDNVEEHPVFDGINQGSYVYFVHSFYAHTDSDLTTTNYGKMEFASTVVNDRGNVVGTQFHPEKSGDVGLRILNNFVEFSHNRRY
ncbi:MAG: imidazole glycerol phosphate synthase subunit HisH [Halobacteria archaeon]